MINKEIAKTLKHKQEVVNLRITNYVNFKESKKYLELNLFSKTFLHEECKVLCTYNRILRLAILELNNNKNK